MKSLPMIAGGLLAIAAAVKLLLGRLGGEAWDGLASVVSYSSKLIAAARAVETAEEHPLVADPLAEGIAGAKALASSRSRAQPAPAGSGRRYKLGKMAVRTRWFDDQVEAALGMPVSATIPGALRAAGAPPRVDLAAYVWSHPDGHEPRQVVMLGAGMDSRPWRMKLPADLRWFEVDRCDVIEAKQALLKELKAEVPAAAAADAHQNGDGTGVASPGSGLAHTLSLDHVRFPLRCGSWTPVAADLADPGWIEALQGAGWDPSKPTVWVAEGLLMYLDEAQARALLAAAASRSPDGSALVALSVTTAVIDRIRERGAGGAGGAGGGLMGTWKFGCPPDPTEFLAQCGWRLQLATDRERQARALGLAPELCNFPPFTQRANGGSAAAAATANGSVDGDSKPGEAASLFLVATPLPAAAA